MRRRCNIAVSGHEPLWVNHVVHSRVPSLDFLSLGCGQAGGVKQGHATVLVALQHNCAVLGCLRTGQDGGRGHANAA